MATSPAVDNPLSPADIKSLEKAIYQCNLNLLRISRAESAGINQEEEKLRCLALRQQAERLLTEYRK